MKNGERHELKFLISSRDAELLRIRLPNIMERDPYAGESGKYTIRSLYFDDWCASALEEKESGLLNRAKYRIRYYNNDPSVLKLERKEKHGSLTRKLSQSISLRDAEALQRGLPCPDHGEGLVEQLYRACRYQGFRPAVLVDYDRTPFVCRDGNTRITLDENVRTRPYQAGLLASDAAMIPVLEPDTVILEVKFDDFLPGQLAAALEDIPKVSLAISKFALCMNIM